MSSFFSNGSSFFPTGSGGPPPPPASGWRLLTFADLGARVGTPTQWTASDSGDPEYPIRLVAVNAPSNAIAAWPILGEAQAILERGIAAPILISARRNMSTSGNLVIVAAVGTHGPLASGAVTTAIGGGVYAGQVAGGGSGPATIQGAGYTVGGRISVGGAVGEWQAIATVVDTPHSGINRVATSIVTSADGQSTTTFLGPGVLGSVAPLTDPTTAVWSVMATASAGTPSGTLDLAIWIMDTPPPAPWAPQP